MTLQKLYDRLTERERVSALVAAWVRNDELDAQRLNATAPRQTEQRWHHHDRTRAVWSLAALVRIELLETLANLWHSQSRAAWAADNPEANGEASENINREFRLWRAFADVSTWKLSQLQAAWLIVTERLEIPPEFLDLFGKDCIAFDMTSERLAENTPTAQIIRERLAEFCEVAETIKLATAESIAAGWLATFAGFVG